MIMVDKRMLQTSVDIPAKRIRGSPIEVDDVNTSVGSSLSKGKSRAVPIGAQDPRLSGSPDLTMSEMAADIKRILVKLEKLETELQAYMQKDKTSSEASVQTAPLLVKQTGSLSSDAIIVAPTSSSEDKKESTPSPRTRRTLPTVKFKETDSKGKSSLRKPAKKENPRKKKQSEPAPDYDSNGNSYANMSHLQLSQSTEPLTVMLTERDDMDSGTSLITNPAQGLVEWSTNSLSSPQYTLSNEELVHNEWPGLLRKLRSFRAMNAKACYMPGSAVARDHKKEEQDAWARHQKLLETSITDVSQIDKEGLKGLCASDPTSLAYAIRIDMLVGKLARRGPAKIKKPREILGNVMPNDKQMMMIKQLMAFYVPAVYFSGDKACTACIALIEEQGSDAPFLPRIFDATGKPSALRVPCGQRISITVNPADGKRVLKGSGMCFCCTSSRGGETVCSLNDTAPIPRDLIRAIQSDSYGVAAEDDPEARAKLLAGATNTLNRVGGIDDRWDEGQLDRVIALKAKGEWLQPAVLRAGGKRSDMDGEDDDEHGDNEDGEPTETVNEDGKRLNAKLKELREIATVLWEMATDKPVQTRAAIAVPVAAEAGVGKRPRSRSPTKAPAAKKAKSTKAASSAVQAGPSIASGSTSAEPLIASSSATAGPPIASGSTPAASTQTAATNSAAKNWKAPKVAKSRNFNPPTSMMKTRSGR